MFNVGFFLFFIGIFIGILIFTILYARYLDIKDWNNGKCKKHNLDWKCFDLDSGMNRLYECPEGCYIAISYNIDK